MRIPRWLVIEGSDFFAPRDANGYIVNGYIPCLVFAAVPYLVVRPVGHRTSGGSDDFSVIEARGETWLTRYPIIVRSRRVQTPAAFIKVQTYLR